MKPDLYITLDRPAGVCLVRGDRASELVRKLVPAEHVVWSKAGGGLVVPYRYAADVEAYAWNTYLLCVTHTRREPA